MAMQVNYNLLTVNVFMAITGIYQLSRKIKAEYGEQLGLTPPAALPVSEGIPVLEVRTNARLYFILYTLDTNISVVIQIIR